MGNRQSADAILAGERQYEMSIDDGLTWHPCAVQVQDDGSLEIEQPFAYTPTKGQKVIVRAILQEPPK